MNDMAPSYSAAAAPPAPRSPSPPPPLTSLPLRSAPTRCRACAPTHRCSQPYWYPAARRQHRHPHEGEANRQAGSHQRTGFDRRAYTPRGVRAGAAGSGRALLEEARGAGGQGRGDTRVSPPANQGKQCKAPLTVACRHGWGCCAAGWRFASKRCQWVHHADSPRADDTACGSQQETTARRR